MFTVLDVKPTGETNVLYTSPGVETLLGYTPEEYCALGCVLRCGSRLRSIRYRGRSRWTHGRRMCARSAHLSGC